jgi:hypothetical protein
MTGFSGILNSVWAAIIAAFGGAAAGIVGRLFGGFLG